jgi:hypothetical protein
MQADQTDSKLSEGYPGVEWIRDKLSRATTKSNLWHSATLEMNCLKAEVVTAIKSLGRAVAMLMATEMEEMRVAHAESESVRKLWL